MRTFTNYLEDIHQAFGHAQGQLPGSRERSPTERTLRKAGTVAGKDLLKAGLNAAVPGLGYGVDVITVVWEAIRKKKASEVEPDLASLRAEFEGMKIPANLLDISPEVMDTLSVKSFIGIMGKTLKQIKEMNGQYPDDVKFLFNKNAKLYVIEMLKPVPTK